MDLTYARARDENDNLTAPGSPSRATSSSLVDPASFLRISLDPALKALTPLHWSYDLVEAIRSGDVEYFVTELRSKTRNFSVGLITEPLGPERQNLLHVAALLNQPAIVCELLRHADRFTHVATEAQRLSVREESLAAKGNEPDIVAYQIRLGAELDKVDRVRPAMRAPAHCPARTHKLTRTRDRTATLPAAFSYQV